MAGERFAGRLACALFALLLTAGPAWPQGSGVTLSGHGSYGAGASYSDVYYHKNLAFIGTFNSPGRVYIADPATAALIGTYNTSNGSLVRDMQAQGNYLYVALDAAGFDIVDISNPAAPALVSNYSTGFAMGVHDLFIHGDTLYCVRDNLSSDLFIFDVSNRAAPVRLTVFDNPGGCHDVTVVGNRAYLANLGGGFQILDVTNPAAPVSLAINAYPEAFTHNIWPSGDGRYVCTTDETCTTGHLRIWDVSNLPAVTQVAEYAVPNQGDTSVHNAMWVDNYIYLSYYLHGLRILDVTNPLAPVEVGFYDTYPDDQGVRPGGGPGPDTPDRKSPPAHEGHDGHGDHGGPCFAGAWGVYAERSGPSSTNVYISDIQSGLWSFSFASAPNLHTSGVGLYNPATSTFFLRNSTSPGAADVVATLGRGPGLVGLSGDWDGNGSKTLGVFDPVRSAFYLKNTNAPGPADLVVRYGPVGAGWLPVVGDWDGNDTDTVGLYAPQTGTFYLRDSNTPGPADTVVRYGPVGPGVKPIVGDWDNTKTDTVGVYVAATATFFLRNVNAPGPADMTFAFGPAEPGAEPVTGNWDGVGGESVGVYLGRTGVFFLRNTNVPGPADVSFVYGPANAGLRPLAGDWTGPGH